MKYLVLISIFIFSSLGLSQTSQLPDARINQETLGGDLLLVQMRDYLIISGAEARSLIKELGSEGKKTFTRDIVMGSPLEQLVTAYNPTGERKTVTAILSRYKVLTEKLNLKATLN